MAPGLKLISENLCLLKMDSPMPEYRSLIPTEQIKVEEEAGINPNAMFLVQFQTSKITIKNKCQVFIENTKRYVKLTIPS